jgi:IclR family transcriptional regulator, KDG regulon repressor
MSSLSHAIRILRCFSADEPELRLSDISERLGLSRSYTHELLTALTQEGLLGRSSASSKYRLGFGLFELWRLALGNLKLSAILPVMIELGLSTGENVSLGVRLEFEVIYPAGVNGPEEPHIDLDVDRRAPLHCTASGKVLIAWEPAREVRRVIRHGLPALTPQTITDPEQFLLTLAEVRRNGYATTDGEQRPLRRSISVPLRDPHGGVVAALTIGAPAPRMPESRVPTVAKALQDAASKISRSIEPAPPPESAIPEKTPPALRIR